MSKREKVNCGICKSFSHTTKQCERFCAKCGKELGNGNMVEIRSYRQEQGGGDWDTIIKKYHSKCAIQSYFINSEVGWHQRGEY